jgi:hypothetical protein
MMENRHAVHIRVLKTGVVVSYAPIGILRKQLYRSSSLDEAARFATTLRTFHNNQLTPPGLNNPLLKAFTKAALNCSTVAELYAVLNATRAEAEFQTAPAVS